MEPVLSIVATSRNDDHGGNLVGRMQAFAENIGVLSAKYQAPIELIIVEWNPPADKPKLADVVKWPSNEFVTTRIIHIPYHVHSRFQSADKLPLFQMLAKNVGIRRAKAEFVLATNVDILFPDDFYKWVAQKPFVKGTIYRSERHDVDRKITEVDGAEQKLIQAPRRLVAVQRRRGTVVFPQKAGSDETVGLSRLQGNLIFYKSEAAFLTKRIVTVARLLVRAKKNRKHLDYHVPRMLNELAFHGNLPVLHTNGCGDFQLMHIDDWSKIRGYWEFEGFSMHLDTCASYQVELAGIREMLLPFVTYHIDHTGGWTVQTENDGSFEAKLKARGLIYVDIDEIIDRLLTGSKDEIYSNPENWGLVDVDLPEVNV